MKRWFRVQLRPPAAASRASPVERLKDRGLLGTAHLLETSPLLRRAVFSWVERQARSSPPAARDPSLVAADKLALKLAVVALAERALAQQRLSDAALRALLKLLVHDIFVRRGDVPAKARHQGRFGCGPPDFLVISPGKACNLRCRGCYANSGPAVEKLEWGLLERLVREAKYFWGARFFVISGGEPFAYRDGGRGVVELAEAHPDCFFILYTNGTLVDDALARRLGRLGNLSPGLSIEGLRERTDARRGPGVFDKVLAAAARLRREGVLFGVSLTATRENADEVLSDDVVELFFDRLGASYAWVFHYMPIGRAFTLELMPTPEQRLRLRERLWELIRRRRLFLADFWNSATATNGCVAAGRPGGYFHVDWNGNMSPCVFVPYSPVNVRELFACGGTIEDAWAAPFFAALRDWQRRYGYREAGEPYAGSGNWLRPCPIRDHHGRLLTMLREHQPRPNDQDARAARDDPAYHEGLERYGRELARLADPLWEKAGR